MQSSTANTELASGSSGEHLLQERLGTQDRAEKFYQRQVLDHLNEAMQLFVARQDMMFVATSDAEGNCDSTLRAGPPGFIVVLDAHRIAWPEYRGNGVMASRGNVVENPHVGLLFVDFIRDHIGLHVNGRAMLVDDDDLRLTHPDLPVDTAPGRRPEQWVVAEVQEAYIHCSKHIPRLHHHPGDRRLNHDRGKKSDYFVRDPEPSPGTSCATGPAVAPDHGPAADATPIPIGPQAPADRSRPGPAPARRGWWRRLARSRRG